MNNVVPKLIQNPLLRVAVYARYSCDNQRETSIDDQLRRCREVAEHNGLVVDQWLTFTDSALSGQAHALDKREGMHALFRAWANNEFDVLILDAFERLVRDGMEQEKIIARLQGNRRVRLLTADGIDSARPGWELLLRLKGAMSQVEISNLQHRVGRGMEGQLIRGYMIATPAFGYDLKREFDTQGNRIGTRWIVNEAEARIVREIFGRRKAGQSMHKIAQWLNADGVPCARKARRADGGYWRPSRVKNLLANSIYRGEFVWHGSTTYRTRANKRGETIEEKRFPRPELRLVSDETWHLCNTKSRSRSGYGGGKHALAGLITCGHCGSILVLSSQERCRSVYCANCAIAKGCSHQPDRLSVTVAAAGVQYLLKMALSYFLTADFVSAFRHALREKLTGDSRREYEACEVELKRLQRAQTRLSHMLANVDQDDAILAARYEETRQMAEAAEGRLHVLAAGCTQIDRAAVAAQLDIDPAQVLAGIFDAELPPEELRAILCRCFPSIVLEGKTGRYRAVFRIQFAAGAALALATGTEVQIDEAIELRFLLRYVPDNRGAQQKRWETTVLDRDWVPAATEPTVAESVS